MAQPGRAPPPRDKSSFAATCSLLSRYLKDNKPGLQGLAGLAMPPPPPPGAGAFRPPTTMNLLSALDAPVEEPHDAAKANAEERAKDHDQHTGKIPSEEAAAGDGAQQQTIIYAGKVVVFDKFPSTKVKDLLQIASSGGDAVDRASAPAPAAPNQLPTPSQNTLSGNNSDLPIARRNSLHRFLEKRKDRITAKAPYQVTSSSAGFEAQPKQQAAGVQKPWLGLGQEVTVKQVM